eukprot:9633712-Ditylum_brightwellii.AAC.1
MEAGQVHLFNATGVGSEMNYIGILYLILNLTPGSFIISGGSIWMCVGHRLNLLYRPMLQA